ncbi:MAG: tetratricopeptide repeat protein [Candidatus Lokiarchaeota archaeon]|nr:tetratricopeptide repeat protein [Candidatus Lokiarchaeota archaeon]
MNELSKNKNYKKGTKFFNKGDFAKAIIEFNNALKTNLKNPLIYANLGLCYANLEQFDLAIELFDKSLEIDINQAEVWDAKVTLLEKLGKTEDLAQTMKKFDESAKINPELIGVKSISTFDPPLPEGLKIFSFGNVERIATKELKELVDYFLSLFQIPRQKARFFYFKNELLIAIEEIDGAWMKSAFKESKILNLFNLQNKDNYEMS